MEKQKIIGVSEQPTETDVNSLRTHEDVSSMFALNDLIGNPDKVRDICDRLREGDVKNRLLHIISVKKFSDEYFEILGEIKDSKEHDYHLALEMESKVKERFIKDLEGYLDEVGVEYDDDVLRETLENSLVLFLDYVRYFGSMIDKGINEEAVDFGGYYLPDGDSTVINVFAFRDTVEHDYPNMDEDKKGALFNELLNQILRHEFIHVVSYKNFWLTENVDDGELETDNRRLGLRNQSLEGGINRLLSLNEAITEKINQDIFDSSSSEDSSLLDEEVETVVREHQKGIYLEERTVLEKLLEFVDWKFFVRAMFTRDGLLHLARELKDKTGLTLSKLDDLMKQDLEGNYKDNRTISFLEGL